MTDINQPDPAYIRSREAYQHLVYTFSTSLPPPLDATPDICRRRQSALIERVASLCPVNAAEAALAAQFVAADAQASECLQLANQPETELTMRLKCGAQSASMLRQSQAALRTLLRMQAAREKRDAQVATADAAAWAAHIAATGMTEPLAPPTPEPSPPSPSPPSPPADPELSEVALYEAIHPRRAALIRRHGGVPKDVPFGPPDRAIVRALLATRPASPDDFEYLPA